MMTHNCHKHLVLHSKATLHSNYLLSYCLCLQSTLWHNVTESSTVLSKLRNNQACIAKARQVSGECVVCLTWCHKKSRNPHRDEFVACKRCISTYVMACLLQVLTGVYVTNKQFAVRAMTCRWKACMHACMKIRHLIRPLHKYVSIFFFQPPLATAASIFRLISYVKCDRWQTMGPFSFHPKTTKRVGEGWGQRAWGRRWIAEGDLPAQVRFLLSSKLMPGRVLFGMAMQDAPKRAAYWLLRSGRKFFRWLSFASVPMNMSSCAFWVQPLRNFQCLHMHVLQNMHLLGCVRHILQGLWTPFRMHAENAHGPYQHQAVTCPGI